MTRVGVELTCRALVLNGCGPLHISAPLRNATRRDSCAASGRLAAGGWLAAGWPLLPLLTADTLLRADVNIGSGGSNIGCRSHGGVYRLPRNNSIVIHYLKKPEGMAYVWDVLSQRLPNDRVRCKRTVGINA